MRIGFDLDGVVVKCSSFLWGINVSENVLRLSLEEAKPELNPKLFASEEDEVFFITSRRKEFLGITKRWCKKYYPDIPLIQINVKQWETENDWETWYKNIAQAKSKAINNLRLDIYFEDMPITVKQLRELCPNCRIIQYGGRL